MLMPLVSLNNEEANDTVTSLLYIYIFVSDFVTTVDVFENFNLRIILLKIFIKNLLIFVLSAEG